MNNKPNFKKVLQLFISTLIVGFFLVGVISANKTIETIKGTEENEQATYSSLIYLMKNTGVNEISESERVENNDFIYALGLDIFYSIDENTGFAILDKETGMYMTSDEEDELMEELVEKLDGDERKLTSQYDYFNTDCGDYNFLMRINHGGIINLIRNSKTGNELLAEVIIFIIIQIIVLFLFRIISNYKTQRMIGFIFIAIWIGFISISSAFYLNNNHNKILEQEKEHTIVLIDHYYQNNLFVSDDVEDLNRLEYAELIVEVFSRENAFIDDVTLSDKYDIADPNIGNYLNITFNEKGITNKSIEYILSTCLFLILAFILYDETSKRVLDTESLSADNHLLKADQKAVLIIMLVSGAIELVMTLVLPRLLQVYKLNYGVADEGKVAVYFSLGIFFNTICALSSSKILNSLNSIKKYFMLNTFVLIGGACLFSLFTNFYLTCLGYILISIADSMANVLMFFYIAGTIDEERHDEFLIKAQKQRQIGSSVGVIIGGILASIFAYGTVIMLSAFIGTFALILTISISSSSFNPLTKDASNKFDIKEFFKKKSSLLYLLLIAVPLAFQDVFMDYKFPTDILNMGLTTVVISFVSMIKNLVSAYASPFTIDFFKDRISYRKLTYITGIGGALLMIINSLKSSIFIIILSVIVLGLLDSFGELSYRESFNEIAEVEGLSETDGMVVIKTADKLGETIGPNIITLFNNAIALPIVTILSFMIYAFTGKKICSNKTK